MRSRLGVSTLVALCALAFAGASQAAITPGKTTFGSADTIGSTLAPGPLFDRHATAAAWHDGALVQGATNDCITGPAILGGTYVGWFGEVGVSPVVDQTYYIRVGWGITANPCTGGAYVHVEFGLPSFTSLAITGQNKVRCFYKSPSASNMTEAPSGCPQSPTSVGVYGGLSFDPVGASAWPSAFGSLFEIWVPVKSTQPLSGLITAQGCSACLYAGVWMIDGWFSPWLFPVQGVYVKQKANPPAAPQPYVDYPTPTNAAGGGGQWITSGFVYTEGTTGSIYTDIREGTSGAWAVRAGPSAVGAGSWRIDQAWNGLQAGHTYSFRVCYDPTGTPPEVCGVSQAFTLPGGTDVTAPNTTIEKKPAAFTNRTSATFAFDSTELGSTFFCKLDSGAFSPCSAPTYTNLTTGSHTLLVYARDIAGNSDASPASWTWTVDLTKPTTSITKKPPASTSSSSAAFKFKSNETGATFMCKLDKKAWAKCPASKTFKNLSKGKHKLSVYAIDRAGNKDPSPATASWRRT
jgi:hypothetical protein